MDLFARVNILEGRAVRLPRGDVKDAIALDADPIARARSWKQRGADRIYVVDLDAAAYRRDGNRDLIAELVAALDCPVDVGGGIRSEDDAARLLRAGASRIVMGTAALENQNMVWDLCRTYPGQVMISLDVKEDEELLVHGWTEHSGRVLEEVILEMSSAGVAGFMVSEALRDALVDAPNFDLLRKCLEYADEPVVAAGGVRNLEDLRQMRSLEYEGRHLAGLIVGREVTEGRFSIPQAKQVFSQEDTSDVMSTRLVIRAEDIAALESFYTETFGCRIVDRWATPAPAGAIIKLAEGSFLELIASGESTRKGELIMVVDNVDVWHERVVQRGVQPARALLEDPSGGRSFGIDDPAGTRIWISEALSPA